MGVISIYVCYDDVRHPAEREFEEARRANRDPGQFGQEREADEGIPPKEGTTTNNHYLPGRWIEQMPE